ncbi:MAG: sugar transferase [bacterium]|nr:sugar transferase [bacterium]MDZ4296660.1 sugar transferase [Patescibacteria group bacterium]
MSPLIKKTILVLGDLSMLWLSLVLALAIRRGELADTEALLAHIPVFSVIFVVWLIVFSIVNLYEPEELTNTIEFFMLLAKALFANALISTAFFYFTPRLAVTPKTVLFLMLALALILIFLWRQVFNTLLGGSLLRKRSLIIGWDHTTLQLAELIEIKPQLGWRLEGLVRLPDHVNPSLPETLATKELDVPLSAVAECVRERAIESIIISPEAYREPRLAAMIYRHLPSDVEYVNALTLFEQTLKGVPLTLLNHIWFLEHSGEGKRRAHRLFKRLMDIAGVLVVGAVFLLPLLVVAFAIKWGSFGPVFYRQKRLGKNERPFWLLKFRSMFVNDAFGGAEALTGVTIAQAEDPRITRVGRVIRKTHLDEMPQLWNILKGEMSFVGPRPERPEFYEKWQPVIPFFDQRLLVKPGLTGWAQLHYTRGATRETAARNLQYDLYYIKHRSILLDIAIVLKTIRLFLGTISRS